MAAITSTSNRSFQSSSEPESDVSAGNARDKYKIVDRIGEGSQGRVYLAVDKHSGRFVCIKKQVITRCAVSENIFMKMIPEDEGLCKFIEYYFEPMTGAVIVRDKAVYKTNVTTMQANESKMQNREETYKNIKKTQDETRMYDCARILKHSGTNYDLHAKPSITIRRSLSDDNLIYDANCKISPRTARCYFERNLNNDQTIIRGYLSAMIDLDLVPTESPMQQTNTHQFQASYVQQSSQNNEIKQKKEYNKHAHIHAKAAELKEFIETEPLILKKAPIRWEMLCIVTEYVKGPTLLNNIIEGPFVSELIVARVFRMILKAVAKLHENNIVHRDLKCENIILSRSYENIYDYDRICEEFNKNNNLLNNRSSIYSDQPNNLNNTNNLNDKANDKANKDKTKIEQETNKAHRFFNKILIKHNLVTYKPKIIDFGFATSVYHNEEDNVNANASGSRIAMRMNGLIRKCGSVHYMSPELIMDAAYDGRLNDVWSLGVILFMMVFRQMPFDGESRDKLIRRIIWGEYNKELNVSWFISTKYANPVKNNEREQVNTTNSMKASLSLMKLLSSMLCRADKRISARDALNSEWFMRLGMRRCEL